MKNDRIKLGIAAVVIAFVGIGVGASVAQPETITVPGPIQTVTLPAPSPITIEVPGPIVTVEITPQVCADALDLAGEAFGYAAAGTQATIDDDLDALVEATDELERVIDPYLKARDECYASANDAANSPS